MNVLSLLLFTETTNSCSVLLYQLKNKTKLKKQPQKQLSMFGYLLISFRFIFFPAFVVFFFSSSVTSKSLPLNGLQHARLPCPSLSPSLLKLMSIELVIPSNHLILCRPCFLLPSIFPNIRIFSNESALCLGWPKYWRFHFSISLSSEYWGLISFRIDWFDLAVQRTLKSLLQHHSSKASILWCSAFFYDPAFTSVHD